MNKRMRLYQLVLEINKHGMPVKVLDKKTNGKWPRGRLRSRLEHQVMEVALQKEGKVYQKIEFC
jgi:hypothetical protein